MPDRKKVIKGLECCLNGGNADGCEPCPYKEECHETVGKGASPLQRDALELLKEQEQEKNVYTWICPKCGSQIILKAYKADKAIGMSFDCCPVCGKDVLYGKTDRC